MSDVDLFDPHSIVELVAGGIAEIEAGLCQEQAVYGLDSRDEVSLHGTLESILARHASVAREVHFPASAGRKRTHRRRCDLVLTPSGRPLRRDTVPPTLFDPPDSVGPEQALWLEVKLATQFRAPDVHDPGYASKWRQQVSEDLRKVESDDSIRSAMLMLILFTSDSVAASAGIEQFENDLARAGLLAGFRASKGVNILNRIGHRLCTIALWPTISRPST
jgi:hypothetical protein